MIKAEFYRNDNKELTGFCVSGHAFFDDYGKDVVCAAVSSAVQLTVNGITECAALKADVMVAQGTVKLLLKKQEEENGFICGKIFINALKLHLEILAQDYKNTIKILDT